MSAPITIQMTLTGALKGRTKAFRKYQFINGVCNFTGTKEQVESVAKYFTRSYQTKVEVVEQIPEEIVIEQPVVEDDKAVRVDDSKVLTKEQLEEIEEKKKAVEVVEPNARQATIIAAINCIDKEEWVDLNAKTPRPKVKDVQTLTEDPTVSKEEIVEVIKTWLS